MISTYNATIWQDTLTSKVGDEGSEDGAQDDEADGGALPGAPFPPRLAQVEAAPGEGAGGAQS